MKISLDLLHTNQVSEVDISGTYTLNSTYYDSTEILSLSDIVVQGKVTRKENSDFALEDYIIAEIKGEMVLPDSISLEAISYPFVIKYDDFLSENHEKSENTLDILDFLWENIVLEIPLQFTKVRDLSKFHGDGWRVIFEEELQNSQNPFYDLLKDFEEE